MSGTIAIIPGLGEPETDSSPNPRHLDEFVKKHPGRRILPHFEAEQDEVLWSVYRRFENFEE